MGVERVGAMVTGVTKCDCFVTQLESNGVT